MKGEIRGDIARIVALVFEERGPFVGEVVGVVGATEQRFDQAIASVGILAREEFLGFLNRGQSARDVERDAAEERGVVADGRWRNADLFEIREHEFVDEILLGGHRTDRRAQRYRDDRNRDHPLIAHHDGHVAGNVEDLDVSPFVGLGHGLVVGLVEGEVADIAGLAVGKMGCDLELLFAAGLDHAARRLYVDRDQLGVGLLAIGHTLADPADEPLEAFGTRVEPFAAAVRDGVRGLQ